MIMISKAGTKTFYFSKKIHGKAEKIKIGRFPDITIEQARKTSHQFNSMVAQGKNPQDSKREFNTEITFKGLFKWFMESYAYKHKSPESTKSDEGNYQRYLKDLDNRKISTITKADVLAKHNQIATSSGIYAANRTLALISTIYNKAIDLGKYSGVNPAKGIKKFKEKSRDRFLQGDEMARFLDAVYQEPNHTARDFILISLLTGQRKSNVLAMRWEEISFERAEWRIPMTKNGESHIVPLVPQVIQILQARKQIIDETSNWVFPSTGKTGHLQDPKKAWQRILNRANIEDLRLHDLRRTMGSWQTAIGSSSFVVGKSLGHKSLAATAIYARVDINPVRDSMANAVNAMLDIKEK
jgi:integrase